MINIVFAEIMPFESAVFSIFSCENCVISCFKWFSKVLLRLKPRSLDFRMVSLSRYKTKLALFDNSICTRAETRDFLCYMCGHFDTFVTINVEDGNNFRH